MAIIKGFFYSAHCSLASTWGAIRAVVLISDRSPWGKGWDRCPPPDTVQPGRVEWENRGGEIRVHFGSLRVTSRMTRKGSTRRLSQSEMPGLMLSLLGLSMMAHRQCQPKESTLSFRVSGEMATAFSTSTQSYNWNNS